MREPTIELTTPSLLHRAAEHLTDRWAGVFFPELVHRCVAQAHAGLASTARVHSHLGPIAVHAAGNRLAVLARAKGAASAPVRQVLFVDGDDTGPAAIAAGLLAHHAGTAVEVLAQHGTEPAGLAPKPVIEEVLQAADWVISLGVGEALRLPPGLTAQDWPVEAVLDEAHGRALVADLDSRAQALWVEITTSAAAWPVTSGRAPGF